ncbi:MAG: site-2 protease family protein [Bacteroidetes bacterium]|nr:site-2 protease family protein [Bacteroidota bacterium]MDA0875428.1 site-2 protease family protein [Bacteroidota bacterium]
MASRFRFGIVSGIDLFVHWTFLVMLAGLFVFYVYQGLSVTAALMGIGLVLAVFGCVVLHELGHAFMAREFGIPTLDITMYPIGGVARLQRMPREPKQEFWIAVAGPAVNLGIAGALFLVTSLMDTSRTLSEAMTPGGNILTMLMWVNLALVVFNMLPAFPMDGGRVLRAALATKMDYRNATHTASLIGQGMAFLFAVYGIFTGLWTLPLVAVFVFMAARQEVQYVMQRG